jgi:periplasmic divalent cation tolerance protein
MGKTIWIVTTTIGSKSDAQALAQTAVGESLAACAQIDSNIRSVFVWQDKLEDTEEARIYFKVSPHKKQALIEWIIAHHAYEVPEVLAWTAECGHPDYLNWVLNA